MQRHLLWGGGVHDLLMQLFTLGNSKIEVSETYFFDILTAHNDHPNCVKHVLGRIYFFIYPTWVLGVCVCGRVPQGIGTCSFFTLGSSKN